MDFPAFGTERSLLRNKDMFFRVSVSRRLRHRPEPEPGSVVKARGTESDKSVRYDWGDALRQTD